MNAALVIMAAGLGSRFGGGKQIARLGPDGEILMEYAIHDALRSGFDRIILVIKPEMLEDVKALFGDRIEKATGTKICYAFQTNEGGWHGLPIPEKRTKPLGTVHALLSAEEFLDRPFAVMNADDYYGRGSIATVAEALPKLSSPEEALMCAFRLKNTVSPYGAVTRGVCGVEDGYLKTITETFKIKLFPDGTIRDCAESEEGPLLDPEAPISMNLWGFHPGIVPKINARFEAFLKALDSEDNKSECLLPVVIDDLISGGELRCRVLNTEDRWFGLTYPEDKPGVMEELRRLHDSGFYPPALWG